MRLSKKSDDDSDVSFSENEETTDDSVWTIVDRQNLNLQLERNALCLFCQRESVGIQEVIERTQMSHTKPEQNATKGIRTTVTEQKQQEVYKTERITQE